MSKIRDKKMNKTKFQLQKSNTGKISQMPLQSFPSANLISISITLLSGPFSISDTHGSS